MFLAGGLGAAYVTKKNLARCLVCMRMLEAEDMLSTKHVSFELYDGLPMRLLHLGNVIVLVVMTVVVKFMATIILHRQLWQG